MVAHCWRFRDEVSRVRDRIAAGELGEVVKTRGYGVHAGWGPSRLVHRPGARGRGRARRHGRARDRHRAVPARRPGARRASARRSARATREGRYTVDDDGILLIGGPTARTASWSPDGGSRTWAGWRPTPRSTARGVRADLAAGGAVGGLRALHAADVHARRSPSSWMRSRRAAQPRPSGRGRPRGDAGRRGRVPLRRSPLVSRAGAAISGRSTR